MPGGRVDEPMTSVERWGLKPGKRAWVGGHNTGARAEIERHLAEAARPAEGPLDIAFIAPKTADEAVYFAGKLRHRLAATGSLWVVHPNLRSPRRDEFNGNMEDVAIGLFEFGYTEAGAAPLGNDYTSVGFRPTGGLDLQSPGGP